MMRVIKLLAQPSTWEGFIGVATSIALILDAVTTGGSVTGVLGALGVLAGATSIARDDGEQGGNGSDILAGRDTHDSARAVAGDNTAGAVLSSTDSES